MKRMLEIKEPDPHYSLDRSNKKTVYINSSSLEIIQSCMRKAHYKLDRKLSKSTEEGHALLFGSAIHKALEYFYLNKPSERDEQKMLGVFEDFAMTTDLRFLDSKDKRCIENGKKIVSSYFNAYKDDAWVVYRDEHGPFVERSFELPYIETDKYKIVLHGTIDAVLTNLESAETVVVDHKTTSTMGAGFLEGVKPRAQFMIYYWAAEALGAHPTGFMLNGVQVAKTKCDMARTTAHYTRSDMDELKLMVIDSVNRYMAAKERATWPMTAQSSQCSGFSGCEFRFLCSEHRDTREQMIKNVYGDSNGQSI